MSLRHMSVMAAALLAGAAQAAPVTGQISFGGYAAAVGSASMGAATGLDFVSGASGSASPGTAGGVTSAGAGSGTFAGLACSNLNGTCGTVKDFLSLSTSAPISTFLYLPLGVASFDLTSVSSVSRNGVTDSLSLTATGTIHFAGFDDTAGLFTLTAQGAGVTTYTATLRATPTAAAPEPGSLALVLGAGGLMACGLGRRRAVKPAAA